MTQSISDARRELGLRLRELRRDARLTGKGLAERLGWAQSKVSKLETGRQIPTVTDLEAWASVCAPEAGPELVASLRVLEGRYAEWRRQFGSGMRARQRSIGELEAKSSTLRAFESAFIPGLLQTPEYARYLLAESSAFHGTPCDLDRSVRARMQRQQVLYARGKRFHFVVTEAALRHLVCPQQVLVAQLDRLLPLSVLPGVQFGVIPFTARYAFTPTHGFWIHDDRLVLVETIAAELRLTDDQEVRTYVRAFEHLAASARYGRDARSVVISVLDDLAAEEKLPCPPSMEELRHAP